MESKLTVSCINQIPVDCEKEFLESPTSTVQLWMETSESAKHVPKLPVIHGFKHIFEFLATQEGDIVRMIGGSVFEYHDQQIVLKLSALGDTDLKLTSFCLTLCRLPHGPGVSVDCWGER